jgi:hypothetical protein
MHLVKEMSDYESDFRFARELLLAFDDELWRISDLQSSVAG